LRVDADDRLVRAADVLRVDGEVGQPPFPLPRQAFNVFSALTSKSNFRHC
jgi:hypothetical protein